MTEVENLRAMSTSFASPDLSKERVSCTPAQEAHFVGAVNKLVDLEKIVDEEMVRLLDLKSDIRMNINQVEDVKCVLVLRYRYLEFMTWEAIAKKMTYSIRQIHRIHEAALNAMADVLKVKAA
ncbi:MAG: flagellar biosynthesis protein FliA [Ruthenibacterium sp.]